MYKKGTKIIASMLVFVLTMAHLSVIGQVYATSLEDQTLQTNHANVEFDSYFISEEQKLHSAIKTIGEENNLYVSIKVKEAGYLKNAIVDVSGANFTVASKIEEEVISKVENNKIYFNQIKNGNTVEVAVPIEMLQSNSINLAEFSKENAIKLTATYVDENGKEKQIEKEITVLLAWTAKKEIELNMQVAKFIPYNINDQKGLILQTVLQSYLKDNTLPVKENKIEISVPDINGIKPEEIKVVANTTKATNGDETGIKFLQENYSYDENTKKLTIQINNIANEQGNISWEKNAQDEFVITYVYKEEALNTIGEDGVEVSILADSELTIYEASETKVQKTFSGEVTLKDQISNLVEFDISTETENISKGQLYANKEASNKLETEYEETWTANVGLAELVDKIVLEQQADNFITKANTKVSANSSTYYKTFSVDKLVFNKILGEEGTINLYVGTTLVSTINKELIANEDGKIVVDLTDLNTSILKIETSKPIAEGKITFEISKAVKAELDYTKTEISNFNKLELNLTGRALNEETELVSQAKVSEIPFVEPTSQAELTISNSNLSTVVKNENVKLTAILKTDTVYCNLYKNPTLEITLPSYIENINIKNIEVLFTSEGSKLTLKGHQILPNTDGSKTIVITLEGTQTEYTLGAVSKGVNVVITSDITVNKLTPNKQDKISMIYRNSNVVTMARTLEETAETSTNINFVAPTGVITTTEISGYAEGAESITAISKEEKTATIETMAEARNATFTMNVINNYNNTIDNIIILGRTLFKGNKDIVTGQDLGSTITIPLVSNITVNGVDTSKVTVYYSENGEATKDLSLASNAWTEAPANLENVKSYLVVLSDFAMNTADNISFTYNAQIPANLQHNQEAYETYVVYFNNNLETGAIEDKEVAAKLGITTGKGPVLEANMSSNISETEEVLSGNIIKYKLEVKNTGTENAQNVVATIEMPTYFDYIEEDKNSSLGYKYVALTERKLEFNLGTVGIGETVEKEIWLKAYCTSEDTINTSLNAKISSDNVKEIETNTVTNIIKKAYYRTSALASASNDYVIKENSTYKALYTIKSTETQISRENTIITIIMPEELNYESIKLTKYNTETGEDEDITSEASVSFDKSSRELSVNIGQVDGIYGKKLEITTKVGKLPQDIYKKEITLRAYVKGNNIQKEKIVDITEIINKAGLKVTYTCSIPDQTRITASEDFTYTIEIENLSNIVMNDVILTDYLPKELIYQYTKVTYENGLTKNFTEVNEDGYPIIKLNIEGNSKVKVEISVIADIVREDTTVNNKVKVENSDIDAIESGSIRHIIEKYNEDIQDSDQETTKRIMGQVWKDENGDGIKDEKEEKIANVEVMLFNNATGNLVTDSEGNILKQITKEDGNYTFENIPKGKYTVIYLYDTANYSATTYKKEGVDSTKNSDGIDTKITLNGETRVASITEEIVITDNNIYNIDLGLITNAKFDLKLDKTIASITVQDSTGTTTYDYNNTKLAKKELKEKQINNTTIIVEYKITVTNEGAIAGYVKKIVDYMPSEMKFNSELNRDWYTLNDGALYNSSLANTIINPGESKVVTLLLTKKMTEDNLGLYNNTAEIFEVYNDLGIEDVDSIAGNKNSNEDDISSADVLISVKTGKAILYIGLTTSIIATIGIGAYFIKKKVLR